MLNIITVVRGMSVESSLHQVNFYGCVYAFTMMLSSVTVINMSNRKDKFSAARYQLTYGPVAGDH